MQLYLNAEETNPNHTDKNNHDTIKQGWQHEGHILTN